MKYIILGSGDNDTGDSGTSENQIGAAIKERIGDDTDCEIIESSEIKDKKLTPELKELLDELETKDLYHKEMLLNFENLRNDMIYDYMDPIPKRLRGKVFEPVRNSSKEPKVNRNDKCPCGSGKKYKQCCLKTK